MANFYAQTQLLESPTLIASLMLAPENIQRIREKLATVLQVTVDLSVDADIVREIHNTLTLSQAYSSNPSEDVVALNLYVVKQLLPALRESVAESYRFNNRIMSGIRFTDLTPRPVETICYTQICPANNTTCNSLASAIAKGGYKYTTY